MQSMGEKMDESDIDEIIADSDLIGDTYIEINEFAKMIMNRIWVDKLTLIFLIPLFINHYYYNKNMPAL